jgi:outer membrane protein TolC
MAATVSRLRPLTASQRAALDLQSRELQASVNLVRALGGGYQANWPVTAQAQ